MRRQLWVQVLNKNTVYSATAPETALRQNGRLWFLNLSYGRNHFWSKQRRAILHSRSVHLLVCLRVRKQQGIGLYNERQCSFSFCLYNLSHKWARLLIFAPNGRCRELSAHISCPCVFYKATTVINEVQYLLLSKVSWHRWIQFRIILIKKKDRISPMWRVNHFLVVVFLKDTGHMRVSQRLNTWRWMHFKSNLEMTPFLCMFGLSLKWLGSVAALDTDKQRWNTDKQSAW